MLELLSSGIMSLWLKSAGINQAGLNVVTLLSWQAGLPGLVPDVDPATDQATAAAIQEYLQRLSAKGLLMPAPQGMWMQSGLMPLANNAGTTPIPAASLTKIATSLAALQTWGYDHQFETLVMTNGSIKNGVLQGDLIIMGGGNPFFVWEEAIAVGVALNKLGITQVSGNLVITGDFSMNYETNPNVAGQLLQQGLNAADWPIGVQDLYFKMAPGTPRPNLRINGLVVAQKTVKPGQRLLRHHSLPLVDILKQMNIYSDNDLAELLANLVGGAKVVQQRAAFAAGVPPAEIKLINGSGLGTENQISPRAVCAMLMAIQRGLQNTKLTVADLFPVAGRDKGTLEMRHIPKGVVAKTGTLNDVIALAGAIPTRDQGLVWFAMMNRGTDWDGLRQQQDEFLQGIIKQWGASPSIPAAIMPHLSDHPKFGAANRIEMLTVNYVDNRF